MRILDKTHNFLKLYMHACGKSEVPAEFHVWTCLSLLAACVADRVYLDWLRDRPLYPNLYTFLIAESGIGKDCAIEFATQFITQEPWVEKRMNYYRGKLTAPYLLDLLGKKQFNEETEKYEIANSKIWFITPELRASLGKGQMAESLIETMTALYGGMATFKDGTRMHGSVTVKNSCINWLAGTTKDWLLKAIGVDAVLGGFFARVITIIANELPNKPFWTPEHPADYVEVVDYLKVRVQALLYAQGPFQITPQADAYGKRWYYNRTLPQEELMRPSWRREKEFVLKLAMLLALADGGAMVIDWYHIEKALTLTSMVRRGIPELIELASRTPMTEAVKKIADFMKGKKVCDRTTLGRRMHRYGIDRKRLDDALGTLMQWRCLGISRGENGVTTYSWKEEK